MDQLKLLLRDQEKMAELGRLTAGVVHEIKNPLAFVSSSLKALRMDFDEVEQILHLLQRLSKEQERNEVVDQLIQKSRQIQASYLRGEIRQLLNSLDRGMERLQTITQAVYLFARKGSEDFDQIPIHKPIEIALTLLKSKLHEGISVVKDYQTLEEAEVQVSPIGQVFLNVIHNSIQAMPNGGELRIQTRKVQEELIISITDTGTGMSPVQLDQAFEPFFTTKKVGQGTGLGLAISKEIVEMHHGTIEIKSKEGSGTQVQIKLPIKQANKVENSSG